MLRLTFFLRSAACLRFKQQKSLGKDTVYFYMITPRIRVLTVAVATTVKTSHFLIK